MAQPEELAHRTRFLAKAVLVGAAILLVLLVAIPFVVPHQSLPEPTIVFASLFILIAALVAGTAAAYLFMSRVPATPPSADAPVATPSGSGFAPSAQEFEDLVLRLLDGDERRLMRIIVDSPGGMSSSGTSSRPPRSLDAKVSRLPDRLGERGLAVRERQGMVNPTLHMPAWANVTLTTVSMDSGECHTWSMTTQAPPYSPSGRMGGGMMSGTMMGTSSLAPMSCTGLWSQQMGFTTQVGSYWYVCAVSNHAASGMYGQLIVG